MPSLLAELLTREGLLAPDTAAYEGETVTRTIERGVIGEEALADLLAREAGSVVIDLDRGTVEREAIWLVPESLARAHLAVPVAVDANRTLSIAFADPLDRAGATAIAEATGRAVRALVGTLSSVRRALDREYGKAGEVTGPPTQVLPGTRRRSEPPGPEELEREPSIPRESTQKTRGAGTQPVHSLEAEASAAQKHDALLLALIDRGMLTRADYVEALKRMLGRPDRGS